MEIKQQTVQKPMDIDGIVAMFLGWLELEGESDGSQD